MPPGRPLLLLALLLLGTPAAADTATEAFARGQEAFEREDYEAALEHWQQAAALEHAAAEYRIGAMYEEGKGVKRDPRQAVDWYRRAAGHGSERAQFNLGHMYAKGLGVKRDEARAAHWYGLAAERGNPHAQYTLGLMYAQGRGLERDRATAYAWLTVAIHNFNPNMFRDNANEARGKLEQRMSEQELERARELLDEWESARH